MKFKVSFEGFEIVEAKNKEQAFNKFHEGFPIKQLENYAIDVEVLSEPAMCPDCGAPLRVRWSGVSCTKCAYHFCL